MANINELMEGWSFGKQANIATAALVRRDLAADESQHEALGEGAGERGRPG